MAQEILECVSRIGLWGIRFKRLQEEGLNVSIIDSSNEIYFLIFNILVTAPVISLKPMELSHQQRLPCYSRDPTTSVGDYPAEKCF